MMNELTNSPLSVAVYPVAWRIAIINDGKHHGFGYVWLESDLT